MYQSMNIDIIIIYCHPFKLQKSIIIYICNKRKKRKVKMVNWISLYSYISYQKTMNGFTDKEWNHFDKIERIELTLEDFGRMNVINVFKNLKSLTLINVGITIIEVYYSLKQGLDEMNKLEELNLNENQITKINGLKGLVNVKSLHISHNGIQKLEGLETLSKLETLWLCDNKIDVI